MSTNTQEPIHPATQIGHVHLRVANLERALAFYHGVLGFEITLRFGDSAAFLSAGGYHHHIGLNTWENLGGNRPLPAPPASTTSPSSTPHEPRSPTPSSASSKPTSASTEPPTTA